MSTLRNRSSKALEVALGVDERVHFTAADRKVKEALAAYEAVSPNKRSFDAVPTEFLGAESASLTMPEGMRPGCGFRIIARCPCLVITMVYLLCAGALAGVFFGGAINLTVQTELFEDQTHESVQRQILFTQLFYTNYDSHPNYYRRQLYHLPDNSNVQCDHPNRDAWGQRVTTYSIVYSTRDGSQVLSPAVLQRILLLEQHIRRWIRDKDICGTHRQVAEVGGRKVAGFCEPLDSAINYFFPSVVAPGASALASGSSSNCTGVNGSGCLRFDGDGFGRDAMETRAGTRCEPALSQGEVDEVFAWLLRERRVGFFSQGPEGANNGTALTADGSSARVRYVRSRFSVPSSFFAGDRMLQDGLTLLRLLERALDDTLVVQTDFAHCNPDLVGKQIRVAIANDVNLLLVAVGMIFAFMLVYFRNVALALLAVLQITVSFPIMAFVVDVVLRQRPLSVFSTCALFVVTGVSSDNIFVVHETWQQAYLLRSKSGERAGVAARLRWTLLQAARPLFIADVTTAFSLFINCFSPLRAIAQFGLCGGLLIMINFVLVLVYMPALLVLEERGCFVCFGPRMCELLCRHGATARPASYSAHSDTASRFLHLLHGLIYRHRRLILAAGGLLLVLLFPPALGILSRRVGEELQIFGASAEMPPSDLHWETDDALTISNFLSLFQLNRASTGEGGLVQLAAHPFDAGWPVLYRRLAAGWNYRAPELNFALWPSGTVLLSTLLFVDAVMLGVPGLLRYLRMGMGGCAGHESIDNCAGSVFACGGPTMRSILQFTGSVLLGGLGALGLIMQSNERWAITLLGCHYPIALNATLAVGLFVHALIFAGLAAIFLTRLFDRIVSQRWFFGDDDPDESEDSRQRRRERRGRLFVILSLLSLTAMALVISYMQPEREGGGGNGVGGDGNGRSGSTSDSPWQPHWVGICLATLCLLWSIVVMMAIVASVRNEPFGPFLPCSSTHDMRRTVASLMMIYAFAALHAGGWAILALSGFGHILGFRGTQFALGICLLLSAALPAANAYVIHVQKPLGVLRPLVGLRSGQQANVLLWSIVLAAGLLVSGLLLIASWVGDWDGSGDGGRGGGSSSSRADGHGSDAVRWSPPWSAVGIFVVWLLWSAAPLLAGYGTMLGKPMGHVLPIQCKAPGRPAHEARSLARQYGLLLVALAGLLLVLALVMLVLSGFGLLGAGDALRNLFGMCVLLTSLAPATLAFVVGYDTTVCGLLASTEFTRRHRTPVTLAYIDCMLICQLIAVAAFGATAQFFAWWLAVVWLTNAAGCGFVVSVLATRVPVGCLRPLDPPQVLGAGVRLQHDGLTPREARSLLLFSLIGALLVLLGLGSLVLAYYRDGHAAVFGGQASGAVALGFTFLIDAAAALALFVVCLRRKPLFVLQPTRWAHASRMPTLLSLGLATFCAFLGGVLLDAYLPGLRSSSGAATGSERERTSDAGGGSDGGRLGDSDALAIWLACLGWMEALVLLLAAYVQALGRKWLCFRPLASHRASPFVAAGLALGSAAAALFGTVAAYVASDVGLAFELWQARSLPLVGEVTMAAHVALCSVALRQIRSYGGDAAVGVGGPSVLGIFTLGHTFLGAFTIACVGLLGCLTMLAVLPWQQRHSHAEDSGLLPVCELLGGLQAAAALYILFSHAHTYAADLTHAQPQLNAAAAMQRNTVDEDAEARSALRWRRGLLVTSVLLSIGSGCCYAVALGPADSLELDEQSYLAVLGLAVLLLIHLPLLALVSDVFASGVAASGFAPRERIIAPNGSVRSFASRRTGAALAVLTCVVAFAGGLLLVLALVTVDMRTDAGTLDVRVGGRVDEVPLMDSDECNVVFGLDPTPRSSGSAPRDMTWLDDQGQRRWVRLYAGFDPARYGWQQEEMRLLCQELVGSARHPVVHSAWDNRGGCLMDAVFQYANATGHPWPVPEGDFIGVVLAVLSSSPALRGSVGFLADATTGYPSIEGARPTKIAWMKEQARSKYPTDGSMINDPDRLGAYESEWDAWYASLPTLIAAMAQWHSSVLHAPTGQSVFDEGFVTCSQFAIGPTVRAFLEGVTRALVYTPLFSLVAMLLFLGDVYLCYAALYTIIAIIVLVLGVLGMLGMSLGPIESLSFAIVIGVSVDYLVHFAYAFKHSLLPEQYYKSRAVLLARSGSTVASGLTTLCAVIPLISAEILPLRIFGVIFSVVALVSLGCSMLFFNALLMVTGPGIRMTIHSLPSGSALAPVTSTSSTAADHFADAGELGGEGSSDASAARGQSDSGLLVGFGGRPVKQPGTDRTDLSGTTASAPSEWPSTAPSGDFKGHSAKGVIGAIKV